MAAPLECRVVVQNTNFLFFILRGHYQPNTHSNINVHHFSSIYNFFVVRNSLLQRISGLDSLDFITRQLQQVL
jgi:hypothetical protein